MNLRTAKILYPLLIGVVVVVFAVGFFSQDALSEKNVYERAVLAGDYLQDKVGENGAFVYEYYPGSDNEADDYNILRHAGTTYSIFELYALTGDEELRVAGERALSYLKEQALDCNDIFEGTRCVVEDDYVKLGGNGLAIVAMAKHAEVTKSDENLELMQDLAEWIKASMDEDGEFVAHKVVYSTGEVSKLRSDYYPGEAILALNRLYALDGNEDWLDTAEAASKWLITVRDDEKSIKTIDHDHWLLYALNDLYRERKDQIYLDHSFKIAEAILKRQRLAVKADEPEDWLGSYYTPPRSTPTATRSEGLIAAYKLARDFGYDERAEKIFEGIELGLGFQIKTQFVEDNIADFPVRYPERALGGFREDLEGMTIRIDYVQHNLSALLGYMEILEWK